MLIFSFLLGCAGDVAVAPDQDACHDVDYNNPAPSTLEWEVVKGGADIWRTNVFLPQSGLTFDPEFTIEHGVLSVHEVWTEPESDDQFCYVPHVTVTGYSGELELRWYTPDEPDVAFDTVILD